MIEFGGEKYYIDFNAVEKAILIPKKGEKLITKVTKTTYNSDGQISQMEVVESESPNSDDIDTIKFDLIRTCIDVLMDNTEELDSALGSEHALEKTDLNYQIAFNTLLKNKILKIE
jgi:hypothetical protein